VPSPHPHFGATHQGGDVGGISITVADKTGGGFGRVDRSLQDEPVRYQVTERRYGLDMDSTAFLPARETNKACVCDVPIAVEDLKIPALDGKGKLFR
jgi:hypothetical protein